MTVTFGLISALVVTLAGCDNAPPMKIDDSARPLAGKTGVVGVEAMRAYDKLTPADKDRLRQRKVFFGHQSVGQNLVDGAKAIGFPFQSVDSGSAYDKATWGEGKVDTNGNPQLKISSFKAFLQAKGIGNAVEVAGFKFCWIDFKSDTDGAALLGKYDDEVKALKAAFPKLAILHMTPPLTTDEPKLNEVRWKFGRSLLDRYKGDGLVVDLAEVISTKTDGTVCAKKGTPRLCDEWSSDEGHLNGAGSERAAKAFVVALQRL